MNLELITKQVSNLCRANGRYIRNELDHLTGIQIEEKGENSFVTYVDRTSEERLVSELAKILPEAGFIAEENDSYPREVRYNWVIDPLDGTTNFIHGVPLYSVSVALLDDNEVISGVILEVNLQECFYAWKNGGAWLNGQPINVSKVATLKESLLATGFPYSDYSRMEEYLQVFNYLIKNSHGLRRLGSAAADLAYVACGRFDGFYEYGLNPWDVAAGSLIVTEAGGRIGDFEGGGRYLFGEEIIASNNKLFDSLVDKLRQHFKLRPNP
ncbi:MAG: inositol monophosphatase [Bacteroidales bacterium]|nr:inositol monophosphatase [Bacteroidales bacterium]